MSIYTHHGWLGFMPHGHAERHQEKFEAQQQWEEDFYGSERCDFGEADEAAASAFVRYPRDREVNLGGILAQADRVGD